MNAHNRSQRVPNPLATCADDARSGYQIRRFDGSDRARPGRSTLRPDGSVIVPPALASEVVLILSGHLDARVRTDGGELSTEARRLLVALQVGADHATAEPVCPAATGSASADLGTVEVTVTVTEAAALMECSPRWIRSLIEAGRLPARRAGERLWLVDRAALDHYRQGGTAL
ncbi:helix-turn-helix domain-containing protein [Streptomyces sp. NPDC098789]|uniref:helix-turn-helix domain-containing protein n=1 Tax=Streptomyces sp. NPDC098789 TaxID=3366098 RepID=UPI00382A2A8F